MSFRDFFFGRNRKSNNGRCTSCGKLRCNSVRARNLAMEPLETRDLLSVTTGMIDNAEYDQIRAQYPDFNLPELQADLNVMTITPDDGALSLADLKSAIADAGTTQKPDLILVRTSATANSVTYASNADEITIEIDSAQYGSIAILGWGEENFTLDANQQSRVMTVTGSSAVVNLGGLTITGGKSSVSASNIYSGGGIYNSGTLTVTNCTISGNTASGSSSSGGGIYNYAGTLTVTNSTILGNTASSNNSSNGGGIFNGGNGGTITITSSTISRNTASTYGGGIYNSGTLTVTDSTISRNTASTYGGGIYNSGTLTITNSTISANATFSLYTSGRGSSVYYSGGGIYNSGTLTITNSEISRNTTSFFGGGICNSGSNSNLMVINSTITGNTSNYGGGIVNQGILTVTNSEISKNSASQGGGISNIGTLTVTNSTITGNNSLSSGGICNYSTSINFYNTIIACNKAENDADIYTASGLIIAYNCLSSYTEWDDGADNIVYDETLPLFIDATNGDYRLAIGSQAIDKGNNQNAVDADGQSLTVDLANVPRIQGESVDIGAYEFDIYNQLDVPEFTLTAGGSTVIVIVSMVENASSYTVEYQAVGSEAWTTITNIQDATAAFVGNAGTAYNVRVQANGNENYIDSNFSEIQTIIIDDTLDAQNDFVKATLNTPAVIDYRVNDEATDWSVATVQFGKASHGEYTVNEDGTIVYNPENGFYGTDTVPYAIINPAGKMTLGSIAVSVGLPIATSVQKTSGDHTPSTAMAASVDSLTEWDSCYIELWAQGVNELSAGETTITMSYNPAVYSAPTFADCADGAVLSVSQGVELPDGNVQVELTVSTTQALSSQTDNLFLGTVVLTPSMEEGAGIADPLVSESICTLDGVNLTTTVETMSYDLTHSGNVGVEDFVAFATVFGLKPGNMSPEHPLYALAVKADFNKDGVVNSDDFIIFSINFGASKSASVKPVAQPGATAERVRNDEVDNSECGIRNAELSQSDAQLESLITQSSPDGECVIALPLVAALPSSIHSQLETEAYSAALLDLYDNQNESSAPALLSAKAVDEFIDCDDDDAFDYLFDESGANGAGSDVDLSVVLDELEIEFI